ncbi:MAG: ParB/RepB/Spo0J family partition protein [Candidatus Acidiferrum sp.]
MNVETEVRTAEQTMHADSFVRELKLEQLAESKTNPRGHCDETALAELAASIRLHGVLQPVIVRPHPDGRRDAFELVVGSRRCQASKLARRETIRATVRELTDSQVIELQLVENLHREDVHELDDASGYAALQRLNPNLYTVETIAQKIGRSPAYVSGRLQLEKLVDEAKRAFRAARITVSHAFEIARLQEHDQQRALRECFPEHRSVVAALKDGKAEAVTVRELRAWIEMEIHLDLANAPFSPQDACLLPSAGSCTKCPKRTGNNPLLFPETGLKKSTCTDRDCYRRKVAAIVQLRVAPLEAQGEKILRVTQTPAWQAQRPASVLCEGQFHRAKQGGECPTTKPAVVVDGKHAGTLFHLCQNDKCPVHATVTWYQPTPQEQQRRRKERFVERVEKESRVRLLDSIRKKLPDSLTRPDNEMVALDYFGRLGHDAQRRLVKIYEWEEKKTKASWGGETVDYGKIGASAIEAMNTANLQRFLVVCTLASDLTCPGYGPSQPLAKESNLARTAARYKIDIAKTAAMIRAELMVKEGAKTKAKKSKSLGSVTSVPSQRSKGKQAKKE